MDDELSDEENEPKNYDNDKDNQFDQNKNIKSKTNEPYDK